MPGGIDINARRPCASSIQPFYEVLVARGKPVRHRAALRRPHALADKSTSAPRSCGFPKPDLAPHRRSREIAHVGETAAERRTREAAGLLASQTDSGGSGAIGLDLEINAPGRIFLRGRGIDAEFGGAIRITRHLRRRHSSWPVRSDPGPHLDPRYAARPHGRLRDASGRFRSVPASARRKPGGRLSDHQSLSKVRPPSPRYRSAPIPSCPRTRSSRSSCSGGRCRRCPRCSFCNWPTRRAHWRGGAPMAVFCRTSARGWGWMTSTFRPMRKATPRCAPGAICRTTSIPM